MNIKTSKEYKEGRSSLDLCLNTNVIELISITKDNFKLCLEVDMQSSEIEILSVKEDRYLSKDEIKKLLSLNTNMFYTNMDYSIIEDAMFAYHFYIKDNKTGLFIEEDLETEFFYELEELDKEISFMSDLLIKTIAKY